MVRFYCRGSALRHIRQAQINYILLESCYLAQFQSVKEPVGLSRSNGKRPDGATLMPWTRGKPLAWNIASSFIGDTVAYPGMFAGGSLMQETLVRGRGGGMRGGDSLPWELGSGGVTPDIILTSDMFYTRFSTYFVVKFILIVLAFKVF